MPYKNPEDQERNRKSWYAAHREQQIRRIIERKLRMREVYQEIKANLRCADCGETHPACLHFHHRNPAEKEFSLSVWVKSGKSVDALWKEIGKCIVLCANCHAKRHYEANIKGKHEDLGAEGQLQALADASRFTPDEERLYNLMFGGSGNVDQEYRDYQDYYGVDPKNRG